MPKKGSVLSEDKKELINQFIGKDFVFRLNESMKCGYEEMYSLNNKGVMFTA